MPETTDPLADNLLSFDSRVAPLRDDIDRIDAGILDLLARRNAVVTQIVALKKAYQVPVSHPAREQDMISRLRNQARESGLDPDLVEALFRVILRGSRVRQSLNLRLKGVRPGAGVLIIGGKGQMGKMFADLFEASGYDVRILEPDGWDRAALLCRGADLVLVSVPIAHTGAVIRQISPLLSSDTLLADLTSIKQIPVTDMCRCHPGPVMGLHPLFGPSSGPLDRQIIVSTPGRDPDTGQWLVDQLSQWGAVVVGTTPAEHDRIMEIVQALRHFATFCFGSFLHGQQVDIPRTLEFSSPIYRLELGMVGRLFAQDAALYAEIIFASPERRNLLTAYIESLNKHLPLLETGDKEAFIRQFECIARWFGPFSEQALRESSFLIDRLIERF